MGVGNWKRRSQSGHYCYSGLLIIAQRVSRKCLANDPFLVWYPHNKLHLHIIYKVCLIYSVSNQFAFLSHYGYVFVIPCVSWVVSEWLLRQLALSTLEQKLEIISKICRKLHYPTNGSTITQWPVLGHSVPKLVHDIWLYLTVFFCI